MNMNIPVREYFTVCYTTASSVVTYLPKEVLLVQAGGRELHVDAELGVLHLLRLDGDLASGGTWEGVGVGMGCGVCRV